MRNYSCLLWVLFAYGVTYQEIIVTAGDAVTDCNFSTIPDVTDIKVTAGYAATLCGFPELQRDDQILWKFDNSIIVKVEETANINEISKDEKFKDRLKLDKQTGSLNITKAESKHAGTYQLEISGNKERKTRQFSVTVYDVESKSKTQGDSFSLSIDVHVQKGALILWKFKNQVIPTDGLNESWSNIEMNKETGELRFKEIKIEQSGNYEVEINTSSLILHRKFSINVGAASGLCGAGVSLVVWAAAVFLLQEV